jgi:hypothetical protein
MSGGKLLGTHWPFPFPILIRLPRLAQELNTAADFNLLYGELYPLVQSLPQLLLHEKVVVQALLSRMHMGALLSLEPILRYGKQLIARHNCPVQSSQIDDRDPLL